MFYQTHFQLRKYFANEQPLSILPFLHASDKTRPCLREKMPHASQMTPISQRLRRSDAFSVFELILNNAKKVVWKIADCILLLAHAAQIDLGPCTK